MRTTSRSRILGRSALCVPAILLALLLLSCEGRRQRAAAEKQGSAAAGQVVAVLGGEPLPYQGFERYLTEIAIADLAEGDEENTIKSRLLDQYLEERLLLATAMSMEIVVSDAEVDAYLAQIGITEGGADAGPEGKEAFRRSVRESLILQKVKDESVLSKVQVTPGEVDDYLKKHPELLRSPRMVALRQILVDDRMLAERLRAQLAEDPSKFEDLAQEHSVAPDRGQTRTYEEAELPVDLREPIFALSQGEVSPVMEHARRFFVFQLVRKVDADDQDPGETRRRVQIELFQQKGEHALRRFIADLKEATEIRVNRSILPFNYVGEFR
ncbi:MAG: peptidylprolyl isomerase [Acidobacteria bacterium]|nr:peptidylprolyl isomerase [Acidobacteriota bacterium]